MKIIGAIITNGDAAQIERTSTISLRRWISQCKSAGVGALFVNGSMGAFALLTDKTQEQLFAPRSRRLAGTPVAPGDTGTRRAVARAMFRRAGRRPDFGSAAFTF
jgi:dihydrodipicolinate synthase/N-acetylneuraminate lyase